MTRFVYALAALAVLGGAAAAQPPVPGQIPYQAPPGQTRWERLKWLLRSDETTAYGPQDEAADRAREAARVIVRGPAVSPYSMIRHDKPGAAPMAPPSKPPVPLGPRPGFLPPQAPNATLNPPQIPE